MRTDGVHDLDGVSGGAGPANTGLVLSSNSEDVLLVLHHVIQGGGAVGGGAHHGRLPLHRGPVTKLDDVGGDLRAAIELGRFPGNGSAKPVNHAHSDVLWCIRYI